MTPEMIRWVDMEDDYRTMVNTPTPTPYLLTNSPFAIMITYDRLFE